MATTRDRLVESSAELFRKQGYNATGVKQSTHGLEMAVRRRPMERICVIAGLTRVRIRSVRQE